MAMLATWTDCDGDSLALTEFDGDGLRSDQWLWLIQPGRNEDEAIYSFDADDAESFAEHLIAWARKQREGK